MYTNTNIDGVVSSIERDLTEARRRFDRSKFDAKAILDGARSAKRGSLTADETSRFDMLTREGQSARQECEDLEAKLARAKKIAEEEAESDRLSAETREVNGGKPAYDQVLRVGSEQQAYRSPSEHGTGLDRGNEPSFLQDLYMAQVRHDPAANARLERHGRQVLDEQPVIAKQVRSFGTSVVPGFAPPQYLVNDFALFARQSRVVANLVTNLPLEPQGMTTNIPRVTTSTLTAVQASENAAIGNQDPATTLLTNNVVTIGGYVVASRQAIERGTITEQVVFGDLAADYNKQLDNQLLNGSGASGQHAGLLGVSGINSVVFTQASPTVPLLFPKVASAIQLVWQNRFAGPTAIVTSPREWAWIMAAVDSSNRPLVEPMGTAVNPMATLDRTEYGVAPVGQLFNQPVYVDANCPDNVGAGTNESRIIAANWSDMYLFEDTSAPVQLMFEQPSGQTLGILLVCYGYSSFAAGRQPKGIAVVSGTGLITPAL
jgi:HK97 family phage major capsid protein